MPNSLMPFRQPLGGAWAALPSAGGVSGHWFDWRQRSGSDAGYLLVGNAAHTLHPVAGQGLNLSIREADLLASAVSAARATRSR